MSRELVAELGSLGASLCGAIELDDVVGAIAATNRMRGVRASLVRERVASLQARGDDLADVVEVATLALEARRAECALDAWLARELPPDAGLIESPLGAAVVADAMLPSVWDHATDLVVLVGAEYELVAHMLRELGQRRIVVVGAVGGDVATEEELVALLRTFVPITPERFAVRGGDAKLRETVRDTLSQLRVHHNTVHAFARKWLSHGLANLPAIASGPSIAALRERVRGKPFVIVAPGPSLAINVGLLKAAQERAVICAVSHALGPVLAAGVRPDLVITVDPQDVRYHFAGSDLSETTVVHAATVHPALFELPAQQCVAVAGNGSIDAWLFDALGEAASVPGGGSVATSALSLALLLEAGPIAFVGLDLAFSGGRYYVATSHDGGARAVVDASGTMRVEGWSADFRAMKQQGGPSAPRERSIDLPAWTPEGTTTSTRVPSSFMFGLFHRWFVERLAQGDVAQEVFDCTEGGAAIAGMIHRRFADVIAAWPVRTDRIGELPVDPVRAERACAWVETTQHKLRRVRSIAGAVLACTDLDRLVRLERALTTALAPIPFVSLLAQSEIEHAMQASADPLAVQRALVATLVTVVDELLAQL